MYFISDANFYALEMLLIGAGQNHVFNQSFWRFERSDACKVTDNVERLFFARHKQIFNSVATCIGQAVSNLLLVEFVDSAQYLCALKHKCRSVMTVSLCDLDKSCLLHSRNTFEI